MKYVLNNINHNDLHTKVSCNKSFDETRNIDFLIQAYDPCPKELLINLTLNVPHASQLQVVHASNSIAKSMKLHWR
ncbi:MAG: hypothetical protein H0U57_07820 [Tatlockia sp.]|nr:hypothetical protein [Tatlockia sp.]